MVVDALVLDGEQLDDIPIAVCILSHSVFVDVDDSTEVLAVSSATRIDARHELLAILDGVLYSKRNDVAAHTIDAYSLVALHLGELGGDFLIRLAA